jgi:hypothetical protein
MEHISKSKSSAKISVVGLFAVLTFTATLPIALLLSQEKQDPRSKAAEITPSPLRQGSAGQAGSGASSGNISGYTYNDVNKNGERDLGEKPYPGATVMITQVTIDGQGESEQTSGLTTDTNGYFKFHFSNLNPSSVSYIVKLMLPDGYKTISTNPTHLSGLEAKENIDFGLFPLPIK